MVTINELINSINGAKVLSGYDGLNNEIKTISFIDAPSSVDWLRGGEVILTTAFLYKENENTQLNFIQKLIEKKVVALGIKIGRYIDRLPESIVEISNKNGFPIFSIYYDMVWSEIFSTFYELSLSKSMGNSILSTDIIVFDKLFRISTWNKTIVQEYFLKCVNIPAAITNNEYEIICTNKTQFIDELKSYCEMKKNDLPLTDFKINFLIKNKRLIDVKICEEERLIMIAKETIIHEKEVEWIKLLYETIIRRNSSTIDNKLRWENFIEEFILDELVISDEDYTYALNYREFRMFNMLIMDGEGVYDSVSHLQNYLNRNYDNAKLYYVKYEKQMVVAILCMHQNSDVGMNIEIREMMQRILMREKLCNIYIGKPTNNIKLTRNSFKMARFTMEIGNIITGNKQVLFYSDVSCLEILLKNEAEYSEINYICEEITSFPVCETLEAYLESGNFKRAGEILSVHDNTVRYRIEKIEQCLNIDLNDPLIRLNLLVKERLWKINQFKNCKPEI